MKYFLQTLKERNSLLYWFGWYNFALASILFLLIPFDSIEISGVSRWLKPAKFYITVWILVWTLGWLMQYLTNKKKVVIFTWLTILTMLPENGLILMQAIRKTSSHFNISHYFDANVFMIMGICIGIFTLTVLFIFVAFFQQKNFDISYAYLWGIRCGLFIFLLASVEGGYMISIMKHSIGGADGSPGLPLMNWSKQYGDLRIAHFLGVHALQWLPLLGWLTEKKKFAIIIISILYLMISLTVFAIAILGKPLF